MIIKIILNNFQLMNISNKEKNSYHFYINNKEESNIYELNQINKINKIKMIKIIIDENIKSLSGLFKDCNYIKKINFIKFNRNDIINMSKMFKKCIELEGINFNNFVLKM